MKLLRSRFFLTCKVTKSLIEKMLKVLHNQLIMLNFAAFLRHGAPNALTFNLFNHIFNY